MDRKPLADTMVAFIPLELRGPNKKITELAFGKTDDEGRFELRTSEARGVLPGAYRVLFFRPRPEMVGIASNNAHGKEAASTGNTIPWDTTLMLAAIERFDTAERTAQDDVGDVPIIYNVRSTLGMQVTPGSGTMYPKFELDGHPKN